MVVGLSFLALMLRSCTRDKDGDDGQAAAGFGSGNHLIACAADPETGVCFPVDKNTDDQFDWENFMDMVRDNQKDSGSSSSRSSLVSRDDFAVQAQPEYSRSNVAIMKGSGEISRSASTKVVIVDSILRSGHAQSGSSNVGLGDVTGSDVAGVVGATGDIGNSSGYGRFGGGRGIIRDGSFGGGTTGGASFGGGAFEYGSTIGGGSFGGTGGGSVGFQGYGGLQGSLGPLPSGKCLRSRSLLAMFDPDNLTTGNLGLMFPPLIDGDCTVSAAILKGPESENGFGGPLNAF